MSPFVVFYIVLLSAFAFADVSHLTGYKYPQQTFQPGTASLKLHTADSPARTQYTTTYGNGRTLPNSYSPPPSGSPFGSTAPLPKTYPSVTTQTRSYQHNQYQQPASHVQYQQQSAQKVHYQQPSQYQRTAQYQPSTYQAPTQTQEPIVTKHFYVHAAPEEPEEDTGPQYIHIGRPQKHYKVIFIKAPTYSLKKQLIPVLAQNEEKTVVYVLSKKPTFEQTIQLPEPQTTEPTKPEVFFVKYKTQEEADRAQQEIQDAYDQANGDQPIDVNFGSTDAEASSPAEASPPLEGQQPTEEDTRNNQYGGGYSSAQQINRKRRFIA